jgi:hypothetical protein
MLGGLFSSVCVDSSVALTLCMAHNLEDLYIRDQYYPHLVSKWAVLSFAWQRIRNNALRKLRSLDVGCITTLGVILCPIILLTMKYLRVAHCNLGLETSSVYSFSHPIAISQHFSQQALSDLVPSPWLFHPNTLSVHRPLP